MYGNEFLKKIEAKDKIEPQHLYCFQVNNKNVLFM